MPQPASAVRSLPLLDTPALQGGEGSQSVVRSIVSNEFVFAVVGHIGSGTSTVADALKALLEQEGYDVTVLKARDIIEAHSKDAGLEELDRFDIARAVRLQDLGDAMREKGDHAAVAVGLVASIRQVRAQKQGDTPDSGAAVVPDGTRRAYILDSLRHPAEVELLRRVYHTAFALIGVVCESDERSHRLTQKFANAGHAGAEVLMRRDEKDGARKHGQRVADTFHLSDYFVSNTVRRFKSDGETSNPDWGVPDQLSRLVRIIVHKEIVRPTAEESAMYAAFGAQARSACLSRQVGACLTDAKGAIISVGTNEVPKSGGGLYGSDFGAEERDGRCAFRENPSHRYCSNTREQKQIAAELVKSISEVLGLNPDELKAADEDGRSLEERINATILRSRVGQLLEFSRAVHAEMEALICAARNGRETRNGRMFVTTFPCHYCARHLVAAGIAEVQYIEPYPKSLATQLHRDSITTGSKLVELGGDGSRVLFCPFTGVAPRLYARAFVKDRDLKDREGNMVYARPEWGSVWELGRISYVELEARLAGLGTEINDGQAQQDT